MSRTREDSGKPVFQYFWCKGGVPQETQDANRIQKAGHHKRVRCEHPVGDEHVCGDQPSDNEDPVGQAGRTDSSTNRVCLSSGTTGATKGSRGATWIGAARRNNGRTGGAQNLDLEGWYETSEPNSRRNDHSNGTQNTKHFKLDDRSPLLETSSGSPCALGFVAHHWEEGEADDGAAHVPGPAERGPRLD